MLQELAMLSIPSDNYNYYVLNMRPYSLSMHLRTLEMLANYECGSYVITPSIPAAAWQAA